VITTLPRLASSLGLAAWLGLAFMPVGCGGSQETSHEPLHHESDGPTAPKYTVDQLSACAKQGAARMTDGSHALISFDADVDESGRVGRVEIRDSAIGDQGIESCMVGVLEAMLVPRYLLRGMFLWQPVSPASRGMVGNALVVGAAVNLVPIVIVAAGVTIIVALTFHVAEEAAEAISQRAEKKCAKLRNECLENPKQPEWNRGDFGEHKDCGACYRDCVHHSKGVWPEKKCPQSNDRPN
jgi:hypothetical protein